MFGKGVKKLELAMPGGALFRFCHGQGFCLSAIIRNFGYIK